MRAVCLISLVLLAVAFGVIYPIANRGVSGGSDRDEALNIAAAALWRGENPYYQRTYLGNVVSPLPGAILLAEPFVAIGNSAYGNLFWLALALVVPQGGRRERP